MLGFGASEAKWLGGPLMGCNDNERICSFATYVNVMEEVIQTARTGEERKLCHIFHEALEARAEVRGGGYRA